MEILHLSDIVVDTYVSSVCNRVLSTARSRLNLVANTVAWYGVIMKVYVGEVGIWGLSTV